jgi:sugar porter (SP) family MFS transporter
MPRKYLFNLRGSALRSAQIWAVIMPAYILFGWNNGVAGPLLNLPSWVATFPQIDTVHTSGATKEHNSRIQGTVVATYTLGAFFGALSCIFIGDVLGRIRTMQLGAVIDIVGTILEVTSFSLPQLIVGRLVTGFGLGALSATAPNWQSECSKSDHRGSAVVLESVFISAGLALSGWVNLGMSFVTGEASWRFPLALGALWALVVLGMTSQMPESPRWLILKERTEEAKDVLAALEGLGSDDAQVEEDFREISDSLAQDGQCRFIDIFVNGELRLLNRAALAITGQMFQQLSGINALAFYESTIFEQYLSLPGTTARILSASVFTFQTLCSPIGVLTVDRFGRRKLMIASALGMGMCMTIVAATTSQPQSVTCIGVACAFLFLFSLFFPVGFLGLTFLYASEISPLMARVPITAMSTGSAWIFK